MAVKVMIPTPLRAYAGKQESVELQAATVAEALAALTSRFQELKKHLFADDGRLRSTLLGCDRLRVRIERHANCRMTQQFLHDLKFGASRSKK